MAKILIVDDSELASTLVATWLASMGHNAIRVGDGYGALPAFQKHRPDLVILDYQLPAASGSDVFARIRNVDGGAEVPIIFLSSESPYVLENMVTDRSKVRFLQKPSTEQDFRKAVVELLGAS